MLAFQRDIARFEELHAQVLGVSSDSLETHREFAAKNGITFPLVSDADGAIQKLYGPGRITFVIDKTGIVRHVHKGIPDNNASREWSSCGR